MNRYAALTVIVLVLATSASGQVTDDSAFRRQQEIFRLDAARENARIEGERARVSEPGSIRSDPAAALDRLRQQNRVRDEQRRIESESDRLRADRQRQERERLFTPSP